MEDNYWLGLAYTCGAITMGAIWGIVPKKRSTTIADVYLSKVKAIASNHSLTPEAKGSQILTLTEAFNLLST